MKYFISFTILVILGIGISLVYRINKLQAQPLSIEQNGNTLKIVEDKQAEFIYEVRVTVYKSHEKNHI